MPAATRPSIDSATVARLRMVLMRLGRRLRQQAEGDVTPSQLAALSTVERLGPITLGALAAAEQVQPPSMTRIVGSLEERKLVIREPDPNDRRIARVRISPEGKRYVETSRTRRNAYLADRLTCFKPDELALLERALPLLERLADPESESEPGEAR
jgi:DNA-binding MarR family transcriptional regulator